MTTILSWMYLWTIKSH